MMSDQAERLRKEVRRMRDIADAENRGRLAALAEVLSLKAEREALRDVIRLVTNREGDAVGFDDHGVEGKQWWWDVSGRIEGVDLTNDQAAAVMRALEDAPE